MYLAGRFGELNFKLFGMLPTRKNIFNKVLIIEDDETLTHFIKEKIKSLGYEVDVFHSGSKGLEAALTNNYVLIIVDIVLPEVNGLEIVNKIRIRGMKIPVLVITDYASLGNEQASFEHGANIFHKKPINFDLLATQVKSLITYQSPKSVFKVNNWQIDANKQLVKIGKREVQLTPKECRALLALFAAKGNTLSRRELIMSTFKGVFEVSPGSIDTLICRIRSKLGKRNGQVLETVHGTGYRIDPKLFEERK